MNVLIVGLGSIGKRHLSNICQLEPSANITVWRQHHQPDDELAKSLGNHSIVYNFEDAISKDPEVAILANPASLHVETALRLAKRGIHLFIEKPLSNRLDGINDLVMTCEKYSVKVMVGYNFRFYQPLNIMHQAITNNAIGRVLFARAEVGQYLPDWRPGQDYRQTVSSKKALGGGALLELSHEIDYSRWFFGEVHRVNASVRHISHLEIDVDDYVEMTLEYQSGVFENIHLDFLRRSPKRTFEVVGENGLLTWDGIQHNVRLFSGETRTWTELFASENFDRNDMYKAELRHFFDCVRNNQTPAFDLINGLKTLEVVLAARYSADNGNSFTID
jgi:predicted dehydrogenase